MVHSIKEFRQVHAYDQSKAALDIALHLFHSIVCSLRWTEAAALPSEVSIEDRIYQHEPQRQLLR